MTQEIIDMARQAGFRVGPSRDGPDDVCGVGLNLERFAKLVAAKEREACAKSLEDTVEATNNFQAKVIIEWCATHIRARGEA